jgi:hypothetical protein
MIQSRVGKAEGKPLQGLGNRNHGRQKHYSDRSAFPLPSIPTGRQSTTSWTRQRSPQRMAVVGDGNGEVSSVPDRRGRRKRRCGSEPYHTRASRRPIWVAGRFNPDGSLQSEEGRPAPQELSGRCPDLPSSLSGDDPVVGPHAGGGGNELEPPVPIDRSRPPLQAGTGAVPNPLADQPDFVPQRQGLSPGPVSGPVQSPATASTASTVTESDRALPQIWSHTGRTQCVPTWW